MVRNPTVFWDGILPSYGVESYRILGGILPYSEAEPYRILRRNPTVSWSGILPSPGEESYLILGEILPHSGPESYRILGRISYRPLDQNPILFWDSIVLSFEAESDRILMRNPTVF
ncbi:hypothetical protein Hamer_G002433 [Homarus americanus]|uniref:Uncharacterized protein n=1 Tax=Homarus americanus TaxID=6706 RepID=A0A8J5KEV5_HOMAM|nr:hypothetical protein Hamer_G002433 [Homarus americanus]